MLSWALQAGVCSRDSAAQGHHREPGVKCVPKYGRDDVLPQLRCQSAVLDKLHGGWVPLVPLRRGTVHLESEMVSACEGGAARSGYSADCVEDGEMEILPTSRAESESEQDESAAEDASMGSDCASDAGSSCDNGEDVSDFGGPWVLNDYTGWCHKAIRVESGRLSWQNNFWGLACRPKAKLLAHFRVVDPDPCLQGYSCCGHSGCSGA